mgnify:CR=1 FL=1
MIIFIRYLEDKEEERLRGDKIKKKERRGGDSVHDMVPFFFSPSNSFVRSSRYWTSKR